MLVIKKNEQRQEMSMSENIQVMWKLRDHSNDIILHCTPSPEGSNINDKKKKRPIIKQMLSSCNITFTLNIYREKNSITISSLNGQWVARNKMIELFFFHTFNSIAEKSRAEEAERKKNCITFAAVKNMRWFLVFRSTFIHRISSCFAFP